MIDVKRADGPKVARRAEGGRFPASTDLHQSGNLAQPRDDVWANSLSLLLLTMVRATISGFSNRRTHRGRIALPYLRRRLILIDSPGRAGCRTDVPEEGRAASFVSHKAAART